MANLTDTNDAPLRLRARAEDDFAFLSSCLQDAIAPIVDMAYEPSNQRFVLVVNRFRWEVGEIEPATDDGLFGTDEEDELPRGASAYQRTNCGIRINGVTGVRHRGLDLSDRSAILNLLAVQAAPQTIMLDFSGGACLALSVDRLDVVLEDLGEPWLTFRRPDHADAADDERQSESEVEGQ